LIVKTLISGGFKMGWLNNLFASKNSVENVVNLPPAKYVPHKPVATASSLFTNDQFSGSRFMFSVSFDGEKNLGEAGPLIDYRNDYIGLRLRSWQLFYESEIAQTIIKRDTLWKISKGLKLEAQPNEEVIKSEGYNVSDLQGVDDLIEYRWENFANSPRTSYNGQMTLHQLAKECYKNSRIGGDVLVVLRIENKKLNVQLIDGSSVQSPLLSDTQFLSDTTNGNKTANGIVTNSKGQHIAYWVQTGVLTFERIEAVQKSTGLLMAFMVNGLRYKITDSRCMPLLSVVLETVKKIERYKEATVGSAENAAKISIAIEHDINSSGENPFIDQLSNALNYNNNLDIPTDINGIELSKTVAAVTTNQTVNLPQGAKLKTIEHNAEVHFKDFYNTNKDAIAAACDIPSSVVFMKHDGSYSASRADLKDWEHTLMVGRDEFSIQFYQRIYNVWLWLEVMTLKISLPNYIRAFTDKNYVAIDAYNQSRWKGPTVPHIDPLKEVQAVRLMLGVQGESLPLITMEEATDFLNTGDSDENMKQFKEELDEAKANGVYIEPIRGGGAPSDTQGN
jgi:capsid protein